jgi:uncharacterized protein (TIGR02996 family)
MAANLEASFLTDVARHPADDGPRLVYADWLDEHGGPPGAARAEFIRLQIGLVRLAPDASARPALAARAAALLARHERTWLGPLYSPVLHWRFERGFVAGLAHAGLFRARQDFVGPDGKPTLGWLRFYADGTVLSVTTVQADAGQVAHWLNKGHAYLSRGTYTLRPATGGLNVRFAATGAEGTVDYTGTLHGLSLELALHSHINGYRGRETYFWVDAPGCDSREEGFGKSP